MTDKQIIRAVAERIFGMQLLPDRCDPGFNWHDADGKYLYPDYELENNLNPLVDANHMMLVVEKMREKGYNWLVERHIAYGPVFRSTFWINKKGWGIAAREGFAENNQLGHAVCLAALQAEGGE